MYGITVSERDLGNGERIVIAKRKIRDFRSFKLCRENEG